MKSIDRIGLDKSFNFFSNDLQRIAIISKKVVSGQVVTNDEQNYLADCLRENSEAYKKHLPQVLGCILDLAKSNNKISSTKLCEMLGYVGHFNQENTIKDMACEAVICLLKRKQYIALTLTNFVEVSKALPKSELHLIDRFAVAHNKNTLAYKYFFEQRFIPNTHEHSIAKEYSEFFHGDAGTPDSIK